MDSLASESTLSHSQNSWMWFEIFRLCRYHSDCGTPAHTLAWFVEILHHISNLLCSQIFNHFNKMIRSLKHRKSNDSQSSCLRTLQKNFPGLDWIHQPPFNTPHAKSWTTSEYDHLSPKGANNVLQSLAWTGKNCFDGTFWDAFCGPMSECLLRMW